MRILFAILYCLTFFPAWAATFQNYYTSNAVPAISAAGTNAVVGLISTNIFGTTNASLLTFGTLPDARLSTNVVKTSNSATMNVTNLPVIWLKNSSMTLQRADSTPQAIFTMNAGNSLYNGLNLYGGNVYLENGYGYYGDGSNLSNIQSAQLTGTISDARLSTNVALLTGADHLLTSGMMSTNGSAGQVLEYDGTYAHWVWPTNVSGGSASNVFETSFGAGLSATTNSFVYSVALDANATNNASNLTQGTLPDARLSANVALLSDLNLNYNALSNRPVADIRTPYDQVVELPTNIFGLHALLYIKGISNNWLFASSQTIPATLTRFNADDLSSNTTITFAADGRHNDTPSMVETGGKIYLLFNTELTNVLSISEVNVESLVVTDFLQATNFPSGALHPASGQGAIVTDGSYLYVSERPLDGSVRCYIAKFRLSDGVCIATNYFQVTLNTDTLGKMPHASVFDGKDIFTTGKMNGVPWIAKISTNDLSMSRVICTNSTEPFTGEVITDDIASLGNYIYAVSEGNNNLPAYLLKVNKTDLSFEWLNTGLINYASYVAYATDDYVYTIMFSTNGYNSKLVRFNPQTYEMTCAPFFPSLKSPNELQRDSLGRFWFTTYVDPAYPIGTSYVGRATSPAALSDNWNIAGSNGVTRLALDSVGNLTLKGDLVVNNAAAGYYNLRYDSTNTSLSVGTFSVASGANSFVFGSSGTASGAGSITLGSGISSGSSSLAANSSIASGAYSVAMGESSGALATDAEAFGTRGYATAARSFIWNAGGAGKPYKTNSTADSFQVNATGGINLVGTVTLGSTSTNIVSDFGSVISGVGFTNGNVIVGGVVLTNGGGTGAGTTFSNLYETFYTVAIRSNLSVSGDLIVTNPAAGYYNLRYDPTNTSFSVGSYAVASGADSLAVGQSSSASGSSATALSAGTANGANSFSVGGATLAEGANSMALGNAAKAYGADSMALGKKAVVTGTRAFHWLGNGGATSKTNSVNDSFQVTATGGINLVGAVKLGTGQTNIISDAGDVLAGVGFTNGNVYVGGVALTNGAGGSVTLTNTTDAPGILTGGGSSYGIGTNLTGLGAVGGPWQYGAAILTNVTTLTNMVANTNDGRAMTWSNALNVINLAGSTNLSGANIQLGTIASNKLSFAVLTVQTNQVFTNNTGLPGVIVGQGIGTNLSGLGGSSTGAPLNGTNVWTGTNIFDAGNTKSNRYGGAVTVLGKRIKGYGDDTDPSIDNQVTADYSIAVGHRAQVSGQTSAAFGDNVIVSGVGSLGQGATIDISGYYSFGAGQGASALSNNVFVWSDGTTFPSTTNKQFSAYAANGFRFLGGTLAASSISTTGAVTATTFNLNTLNVTNAYCFYTNTHAGFDGNGKLVGTNNFAGDGTGLTNQTLANFNWSGLTTTAFTNYVAARVPIVIGGTTYYLTLSTNVP